jgi:hypothetical protein
MSSITGVSFLGTDQQQVWLYRAGAKKGNGKKMLGAFGRDPNEQET